MYVDTLIHRSGAYTHVHEHMYTFLKASSGRFWDGGMAGVLMKLCLRWLGHLAHTESHRMQDRKTWLAVCRDKLASLVDHHRYGVCVANQRELVTIPAHVDGHSDVRGPHKA
jgi:hypothetical protein